MNPCPSLTSGAKRLFSTSLNHGDGRTGKIWENRLFRHLDARKRQGRKRRSLVASFLMGCKDGAKRPSLLSPGKESGATRPSWPVGASDSPLYHTLWPVPKRTVHPLSFLLTLGMSLRSILFPRSEASPRFSPSLALPTALVKCRGLRPHWLLGLRGTATLLLASICGYAGSLHSDTITAEGLE